MLPQDPIILLSYVNTKLRDEFHSLDAFCDGMQADREQLIERLAMVNYRYNAETNQFV